MKIAKMIDKKFNIETPVDEIGYLAMFFASDYLNGKEKMESFVKIMVIMHGKSTASSMVEVANNLIGDEFVIGLDMPLSMKPQRMYEIAKEKVIEVHGGKGVILMVDMGSLTNFGAMIMEETGIEIRTIDMVSTSMVLDVGRKAILGYSIEDILEVDRSPNGVSSWLGKREKKEKIILAACFTGDGLARKVKENLNNIVAGEDIRIKTINIVDDRKIEERIKEMANNYNILAIIGTMEINIKGIQFISAIDVFSNNISEILRDIIEEENIYSRVEDSLREHLTHLGSSIIINDIRILIKETEERLKYKLQKDVKMGMILHICFLIDKLLTGEDTKEFSDLDRFRDMHSKEFLILKNKFKYIEEAYGVMLKDKEIAYILKMFIENNLVCNSV